MAGSQDQRPQTLGELFDLHRIVLNEVPKPGRQHGGSRSKLWCPACGGGREKEKNFFVKVDPDGRGATWMCFRANNCGVTGGGRLAGASTVPQARPRLYRRPTPPSEGDIQRPRKFLEYFAAFGVTEPTLQHFGIYRSERRMPVLDAAGKQTDAWAPMPVIVYPYRDGGVLTNRKFKAIYPSGKKRFEQEKDAEPSLFNIDAFTEPGAGYFVEGEDDCLAMHEASFRQVTTLPNGSPPKLAESYDPATDDDERYLPLRPGDERIDRLERCYLAGDTDEAGTRHMEEMARRLGKHRCWLVRWPEGCKDAKDTLRQGGVGAVQLAIANATRFPLEHVQYLTDEMIRRMWSRETSWRYGSGYPSLDERLRLSDDGLFICTTGIPGHGKTSFWLSYAAQITMRHEEFMRTNAALQPFHTVVLSVESENARLGANLIAQHARANLDGLSADDAIKIHLPWVRRNFSFVLWPKTDDDEPPPFSWALKTIREAVKQTGAKLAIIDPWQEFDDEQPPRQDFQNTTSRWIGRRLRQCRGLAHSLKITLVLITHPVKMKRDKAGKFAAPGGYDIAESQAFASVPEVGLTIFRPNLGSGVENDDMELICWKARDLQYARVGTTSIRYDPRTHCLYPRPTVAEAMSDHYAAAGE